MEKLNFLFVGPLRKYTAVEAADVAKAMLFAANQNTKGVTLHDSENIKKEAALFVPAGN